MCNHKCSTSEKITFAMEVLSDLTGFSEIDARTYKRIQEIIDRTQKSMDRDVREDRLMQHSYYYQLGAAKELLRIVVRDLKELIE